MEANCSNHQMVCIVAEHLLELGVIPSPLRDDLAAYRDRGRIGIGVDALSTISGWRPFESARTWAVDFARTHKVSSGLRWFSVVGAVEGPALPLDIPLNPYAAYQPSWRGWSYFLGLEELPGTELYRTEQAKKFQAASVVRAAGREAKREKGWLDRLEVRDRPIHFMVDGKRRCRLDANPIRGGDLPTIPFEVASIRGTWHQANALAYALRRRASDAGWCALDRHGKAALDYYAGGSACNAADEVALCVSLPAFSGRSALFDLVNRDSGWQKGFGEAGEGLGV